MPGTRQALAKRFCKDSLHRGCAWTHRPAQQQRMSAAAFQKSSAANAFAGIVKYIVPAPRRLGTPASTARTGSAGITRHASDADASSRWYSSADQPFLRAVQRIFAAFRRGHYHFAKWHDDGTDQTIHDLPRWQTREKRGRSADPSLVVLDTQSVHAAAGIPSDTTGRDAGKRVPRRKRGLAVDVPGLIVAVVVPAASGAREHRRDRPAGPGRRPDQRRAHGVGRPGIQKQALTREAGQIRARIDELTGSRSMPGSGPGHRVEEHREHPLQAQRLVSRGILVETEPGSFTRPRP